MEEICTKCPHRNRCDQPCRPVHLYLSEVTDAKIFEKTVTTKEGETITIMYSGLWKEENEACRVGEYHDVRPGQEGKPSNPDQAIMSTEAESPFADFKPTLKQTGIFIDRFFRGWSYEDLAVKYGLKSRVVACQIYNQAARRVLEVLEHLDKSRYREYSRKEATKRSEDLPPATRYFLLNQLFGFSPSEIARMVDRDSSVVSKLIIRFSDKLRAGEIHLIDATPKERQAARKRLDAHRAKRRKPYPHKKSASVENP
jgi:DNA-directed RNA polymerase specialized sigma24 family protein